METAVCLSVCLSVCPSLFPFSSLCPSLLHSVLLCVSVSLVSLQLSLSLSVPLHSCSHSVAPSPSSLSVSVALCERRSTELRTFSVTCLNHGSRPSQPPEMTSEEPEVAASSTGSEREHGGNRCRRHSNLLLKPVLWHSAVLAARNSCNAILAAPKWRELGLSFFRVKIQIWTRSCCHQV